MGSMGEPGKETTLGKIFGFMWFNLNGRWFDLSYHVGMILFDLVLKGIDVIALGTLSTETSHLQNPGYLKGNILQVKKYK